MSNGTVREVEERDVARAGEAPLLEVDGLVVHYHVRGPGKVFRTHETVHAVDGVSLSLASRETLGLVGESGCGKSTTGRTVLYLDRPTAGTIRFQGKDLSKLAAHDLTALRRHMQIVFQDPIGVAQPAPHRGPAHRRAAQNPRPGASEPAAPAGARSCSSWWGSRPTPFRASRTSSAAASASGSRSPRALAVEPSLIVLDEPVSALDVSIQAQILQLLTDLQDRLGLSYLFIAHDLAVVGEMSDRVAVMYLGKIVELAERDSLYARPYHPYTQALFSAVPIADPRLSREHRRVVVSGEVPSSLDPPSGCRFRTRCPLAQEVCSTEEPPLETVADGHLVACHFAEEAVRKDVFGTPVTALPTPVGGGE